MKAILSFKNGAGFGDSLILTSAVYFWALDNSDLDITINVSQNAPYTINAVRFLMDGPPNIKFVWSENPGDYVYTEMNTVSVSKMWPARYVWKGDFDSKKVAILLDHNRWIKKESVKYIDPVILANFIEKIKKLGLEPVLVEPGRDEELSECRFLVGREGCTGHQSNAMRMPTLVVCPAIEFTTRFTLTNGWLCWTKFIENITDYYIQNPVELFGSFNIPERGLYLDEDGQVDSVILGNDVIKTDGGKILGSWKYRYNNLDMYQNSWYPTEKV